MEIITWVEYKARCTDKKGFTLTHYSKLFNAAHCRVNIKGLDYQLGFDERFYNEKEWNNQVDQFKDAHLEDFVEITAEVAEEIKNTLSAYEAELVAVKAYLATGLSGFEYNGAIAKKGHLEMMVANYTRMVELLPTFAANEDGKTGDVMKELKHFHAVECTCDKTGLIGDFIVDQEYYKETGKLAALDGKVFTGLIEMFRYAKENDLKTGRINSNVKPTYWESKDEIKQALQQGKNVYWQNEGYKVSHAQNGLHITFKYSGYYSKLQDSEIKDCFIGD